MEPGVGARCGGFRKPYFNEFFSWDEGMETSFLTDHLNPLEANGITFKLPDRDNWGQNICTLTEKATTLIWVLVERKCWGPNREGPPNFDINGVHLT